MFTKTVAIFMLFVMLFSITGCGSDKSICGKFNGEENVQCYEFEQIGAFEFDEKNPNVEYRIVVGNIVWSVLLSETIVVPIVLLGFYLWEPVGYKYVPGV